MNKQIFAAYDEQVIWGTGGTPEEALADVAQWVSPEHFDPANFRIAPMTQELTHVVGTRGGNVSFELVEGRLSWVSDAEPEIDPETLPGQPGHNEMFPSGLPYAGSAMRLMRHAQ